MKLNIWLQSKKLFWAGVCGTVISILVLLYYTFFNSLSYPEPKLKEPAYGKAVVSFLKTHEIPYTTLDTESIEPIADEGSSRYLQELTRNKTVTSQKELNALANVVPLYYFSFVADLEKTILVNPLTGKVEGFEGLEIQPKGTIDDYVASQYGKDFVLIGRKKKGNKEIYTYQTDYTFHKIRETVEISLNSKGFIVRAKHFGAVPKKYQEDTSESTRRVKDITEGTAAASYILIGLIGLIHWIVMMCKRKTPQLGVALVLSLVTVALQIVTFYYMGYGGPILIAQSVITFFSVWSVLSIRLQQPKSYFNWRDEMIRNRLPMVQGFLLAAVMAGMSAIFFEGSIFLGTWGSPVMDYASFTRTNPFLVATAMFGVGFVAAISEEAVYRRYLIPIFDRFGWFISCVLTSYLWGSLHVTGYQVYPWYLRIIEFMVFVGPLMYWIYKKYGFRTGIYTHYFHNALFAGTLYILESGWFTAFLSFLLVLSPFFIFLYKERKTEQT